MKRFVIIFISLIVNASVFFYRGVMIILLLLILGCSDSNKVAKETNVSIDVINKVGFNPNRSLGFLCVVRQREIL